MRIAEVTSVRVPMSLVDPLRTSHGVHASRTASLVRVTTVDGAVGWGEDVAPAGVTYVGEDAAASFGSLMRHAPLLGGREVHPGEMNADSWWGTQGSRFAKHALESAAWDAFARSHGLALVRALGGEPRPVTPGVVVGVHDDIADTVVAVRRRVAEGYRRVKLKIEPGRDIDAVRAVRAELGPGFALQVDANGAYSPDDFAHLLLLDEFALQFVEQPFAAHELQAHAELARRASTPVCLDESIVTHDDLLRAIDTGACSVVNVKPSRVGGLADAVAMHAVLRDAGIDAWVGGMLETGIGRASCLALAALPGFTLTTDLGASGRYFARDVTEPFVLRDGVLTLPEGPGTGVEPLPWVFDDPATVIETLFRA